MKKFFKILIKIIMAIVIILLSIVMLVISANSEKIPDVTVSTLESQSAALVKGNYNWNAFTQVLKQENYNYVFKNENTIRTSPSEEITLEVTDQIGTRRLFEVKEVYYIDREGSRYYTNAVQQENPIDSYSNRYIVNLIMPDKVDMYLYYVTLNYFEKGEVQYGFKVYVSDEPNYDTDELIKLKMTSILDYEGIQNILSILPYYKNITNVTIRSSAKPNRLIVKCSEFIGDRKQYKNNVIALFALVPELDIIEYLSPDDYYYFTRDEIEYAQGRKLEEYVNDSELWKNEVLYNEKPVVDNSEINNIFTKLILSGLELQSGEIIDLVSIDENSFRDFVKNENSDLYIRKMYNSLNNYVKNVINIDYNTYKSQNHSEPFIMLSLSNEISSSSGDSMDNSGDVTVNDLHNVNLLVIKGNKEIRKSYVYYLINGEWIISEVY